MNPPKYRAACNANVTVKKHKHYLLAHQALIGFRLGGSVCCLSTPMPSPLSTIPVGRPRVKRVGQVVQPALGLGLEVCFVLFVVATLFFLY